MSLPSHIWHLKGGDESGPSVVILGGTHGDELGGIATVRLLLSLLGLREKKSGIFSHTEVRGNLFIGFGNPEAILRGARAASDGRDLNRSFVPDELSANPTPDDRLDLVRARELAPLLSSADILFDIHSTSSPSEPFICINKLQPNHHNFLPLFPVRYILTDPDLAYICDEGTSVAPTTNSEIERHGGIGFCYETGSAQDSNVAPQILANLLPILRATGVITEQFGASFDLPPAAPPTATQEEYALRKPIMMEKLGFTYAPDMDHGWQSIAQNEIIGTYEEGEPVRAPQDGMLVFPSAPERLGVGKKIAWIAEKI